MTRIPVAYGIAAIFEDNAKTREDTQALIDYFVSKGHKEFDTARIYLQAEKVIGQLDLKGAVVDTKAPFGAPGVQAPAQLRENFNASKNALGPHKINIWYLHGPDRSTPIAETLAEVDKIYKEGGFNELGLSNFNSWEVAEIVGICQAKGWVKPTVYQGRYNAIERNVETELIPCLRHFGIRFYVYSPLAMGLLVAPVKDFETDERHKGHRFDLSMTPFAPVLQKMYASMLPILNDAHDALVKHGVNPVDAAQRWLQHHSILTPQDMVVLGASKLEQLKASVDGSEGGPLPEEIQKLFDEAAAKAKGLSAHYA